MSGRPAVFLDRDGTLIEDRHFLRDPADVHLLPGAGTAVRALNDAGVAAVVVTNQSGIARGLLTEEDYQAAVRRLNVLLGGEGAHIDAHYHCPHLPEISGPCDCRKPGALLYQRAATEFGLALARSWWIGDRLRDIETAVRFGGRGALVLTGAGQEESRRPEARPWPMAPDLAAAVRMVLAAGEAR